MYKYSEFG